MKPNMKNNSKQAAISIRVSYDTKQQWETAAKANGKNISAFVTNAVNDFISGKSSTKNINSKTMVLEGLNDIIMELPQQSEICTSLIEIAKTIVEDL